MQTYIKKGERMGKVFKVVVVGFAVLSFLGCDGKQEDSGDAKSASPKEIKVTPGAVKVESGVDVASKENSGEFYYSYNKKKSETESEQKHRTTIDAYLNIRSPYERVMVTMMIKKLSRDFVVGCSPCHDDYANGVIGPSLLGKDGDFIYERLVAFKSGDKKNILMKELVERMDDAKLKDIAYEIAEFNKEIQKLRKGQQ